DLDLIELDQIPIEGVGGHITSMPTFLVQLEIRQPHAVRVEVVANKQEPYVLLGRDVMNHYHIVLYGPRLRLEIDEDLQLPAALLKLRQVCDPILQLYLADTLDEEPFLAACLAAPQHHL